MANATTQSPGELQLRDLLLRDLLRDDANLFVVLDGASVPNLPMQLYSLEPEFLCLYRGQLDPDLAEVAPYLVRLERDSDFTDWVLREGWGNHWGIFLGTSADLRTLRGHFRRFLIVYDSTGKPMYFRYYDPRVLRAYLPTCQPNELAELFGPVDSYLAEDEHPGQCLRFRLEGQVLGTERVRVVNSSPSGAGAEVLGGVR